MPGDAAERGEDAAEDAVVTDPVETVASAVTDTPEETA